MRSQPHPRLARRLQQRQHAGRSIGGRLSLWSGTKHPMLGARQHPCARDRRSMRTLAQRARPGRQATHTPAPGTRCCCGTACRGRARASSTATCRSRSAPCAPEREPLTPAPRVHSRHTPHVQSVAELRCVLAGRTMEQHSPAFHGAKPATLGAFCWAGLLSRAWTRVAGCSVPARSANGGTPPSPHQAVAATRTGGLPGATRAGRGRGAIRG